MIADIAYIKGVWSARYFWLHLAFADIRVKYRRSLLGLTWAVIQPLALTLLLAFVMGRIFHANIDNYAPFIFSGLIIWEFIVTSAVTGCNGFINAEGYIKQFTHPLIIYSLRTVIPCMINLLCAFIGLVIWVMITSPNNVNLTWLSLPFSFILLFFFSWPLATIAAFIGVRFRDFSQMIVIMLQIVYYISPIFFLPEMFINAKIGFLLDYNPIAHNLNLFRMPLLQGNFPSLGDYSYVFLFSLFLWMCTWVLIKSNERKIIFYL